MIANLENIDKCQENNNSVAQNQPQLIFFCVSFLSLFKHLFFKHHWDHVIEMF